MHMRLVKNLSIIVFLFFLYSCHALSFYGDVDKPFFYSGKKIISGQEASDSLTVVTFNIKKARKIQMAVSELRQLEKKSTVDIYLLQEMDEKGVETIAADLDLNYLYIPIAYDKSDRKNIGNAILTRGTIEHPEKLILPHAKWQNQQRRAVIIGEVDIHQKKIMVFSVHTETVAMSRKMRMDQVDSIVNYAKQESAHYNYVLIGGDFNTVFPKYAQSVVTKFKDNGFDWQTSKVGSTAKAMLGLLKPTNDYLFSKGFTTMNADVVRSSKSSDHYPVFATLKF